MLLVVTVTIALFFVLGCALLIATLILVRKIKKMVLKAELAIDSVEAASETIRNVGAQAGGPLALFKIVKAIIKIVEKR